MSLQGVPITVDLCLLPLEGRDAVIGAQWLRTLGPIIWDFSTLLMKFQVRDKEVVLQGISTPEMKPLSDEEVSKEVNKTKQGVLLKLCFLSMEGPCIHTIHINPQLQSLLASYRDVFEDPKGLPPPRSHDHRIPLIPGGGPVCVRPYRYPHFQKREIERIVSDMMSAGTIRPSNSPYSSPVLLVKKHDGSWRLCVDYWSLNQVTV